MTTVLPPLMTSPSRRSNVVTFRPLTNVPLVLAMSISRQRGGLTSTMKWKREKYLSLSGSRKWASFERPTMNVSCSRNVNELPWWGPSVTVSVTFMRPPIGIGRGASVATIVCDRR